MIVYDIYSEYIPNYVQDIIQTSLFQRLKDVSMNCGMEYTQFESFRNCKGVSRYNHSIGVALITYHFTHDKHQTVAALLHDISTPVFAHVIDFMYHDYTNQEATENLTEMMIKENKELHSIFHQYTQLNKILISRLPQDGYWKIVSKKRYINALVSEKRILDICEDLQESVHLYLNNDFDYYVKAIREDK